MLLYLYSLLPLLFLPIDSSSIRDRNFKNDLVPSMGSRLGRFKEDSNSLKVVSNDPFIIKLEMPQQKENIKKVDKGKDTKGKTKKRGPKLKSPKKRERRNAQITKGELDKGRKFGPTKNPKPENLTERSRNGTENSISKGDILKALHSFSKKREGKENRKGVWDLEGEENGVKTGKDDGNGRPLPPSERSPLVKMVYPTAPKTDRHSHKYTYKDLMADRERLEKKIKYIRNMLNVSGSDDLIRVRRRSESDRTANKIAKMFLTLSAVNGLQDRLKPKCDSEDEEEDDRVQDVWEKERKDSFNRKSSSSNEERYKVKKWIEHMKSKRSSSKTCPCLARDQDEEHDAFPLEQKLPKNYHLIQRSGSSEESSEAMRDPHFSRDKPSRNNHYKRRNHRARDDHENKLKALAGRGNKKLELPLDDLELYRAKAKQILQNAEEILDKIKEEEEKRLAAPNILMNQLKELTSRIQADPRSKENDLIRKIQKNLGRGLAPKSSEGTDGNSFLENVKSFILDPYEKAKALTDESAKKLSSYLLRNLGELEESGEVKGENENSTGGKKQEIKVFYGEVPKKEDEKLSSANLAREKPEFNLTNSTEGIENPAETVSAVLPKGENAKAEEQFKKRMQEMMKEQEKQLYEYKAPEGSEESSNELSDSVGNEKEKQKDEIVEVTPKEDNVASPKDETANDLESTEVNKKGESDIKVTDSVPEKEVENVEKALKQQKEEEVEREVMEEIIKEIQEEDENVESILRESEKSLEESTSLTEQSEEPGNEEEVAAAKVEEEISPGSANGADYEVVSSSHFLTEDGTVAEEPKENEEKEEDFEMAPHLEDSASLTREEMSGVELNEAEGTQRDAEPQITQEQVESQNYVESADLIQQPEPEGPVEKTGEEKGEMSEGEENLQRINPNDGGIPEEENQTEKEGLVQGIPETDYVAKYASSEDKDSPDEKEREVLEQSPEAAVTDETPLRSENPDGDQREKTWEEFSEEVSLKQPSGDGEGEPLEETEKPIEKSSEEGDEAIVKEVKSENEEVQNSSEGMTALKAAHSQSDEKHEDPDVEDEITGTMEMPEEEINEKAENLEGKSEALLESALVVSHEEPEGVEMSLKAADQSGSEEDGETQSTREVSEESLKMTKPTADEEESESLKETVSSEVVSEKQNENVEEEEEEEIRVKAEDPTGESSEKVEAANDGEDDVFTEERHLEEPETEESKDTVSVTLDGEEPETLKERMAEDPSGISGEIRKDETLKEALEKENEDEIEEDQEEASLQAAKPDEESKKSEEENIEILEAKLDEKVDENTNDDDEETVKAANNEEPLKDGLSVNEENVEAPSEAALADENGGAVEEVEDETLKSMINENAEESSDESIALKAAVDNEDEGVLDDDDDEANLREANPDKLNDGDVKENTSEGNDIADEALRASVKSNDEGISEAEETPLRAVNVNEGEETNNLSREIDGEAVIEDGETPVRAENPKTTAEALENDKSDEASLRSSNIEDWNNNLGDDYETPLRSEMNSNEAGSVNDVSTDSRESLRASNIPYDISNQIDDNEDDTPVQSTNQFDNAHEESGGSYETLKEENPSAHLEGTEDGGVSTEGESFLQAVDPVHQAKPRRDSEEVQSDNLQKFDPRIKPLKPGKFKVPTTIAKIMKDLGGKEKHDITSIENLNPQEIDDIIGKIGEAEEQNKVIDEVDCRKECACAEDIDTRSRNIGRYEIVKDFLQWMKDLQLNRVLADD